MVDRPHLQGDCLHTPEGPFHIREAFVRKDHFVVGKLVLGDACADDVDPVKPCIFSNPAVISREGEFSILDFKLEVPADLEAADHLADSYSNGRFALMYAKKYMGRESDPEYSWRDIIHLCKHYGVNKIGSDWGFGFYTNAQLRKAFGESRVMLYQHVGNQKDKVKWDAQSKKFTTDRSRVMQDVFSLIKAGPVSKGMAFPNWGIMEPFAADILSVYSEYSETRRRIVFNHPRGTPDDFMHTIVYAFLASQWDVKRPEFYQLGN